MGGNRERKKLFSEGASCPSETCLLEAEVAQPAFCPVWKLTCQSVTENQTWKDPAPPQVGMYTQWELVDTKVKTRKGQGGVGCGLGMERDYIVSSPRWAGFTCSFYSFLVFSNPLSRLSVLSWDTNHFSSHGAAPVRKWSAKIPSSDTEQLLRVARLLSLVDSWLRWSISLAEERRLCAHSNRPHPLCAH